MREIFPYKMLLREEQLLENIKSGSLFGNVQCDIEVPENIREAFANFPPIFKNINVGRDDIGLFMKKYMEKKWSLIQINANIELFLGQWNNHYTVAALISGLGVVLQKTYCFVRYTWMKCFNNFVQPAANARREGDKNINSSVVAETTKLLADSSYGYQIMSGSRNTLTNYLSDEKIHGAINNNMLKRLGYTNDQLFEMELVESEFEHKEPIIFGFFILQCAKLRKLEL